MSVVSEEVVQPAMGNLFDTGVIPAINDHLLKEAEKVRDYGDYWSASSAGYCMRKVIFERLGVPPVSEDARKQRVFSSGHIFHEWIQAITKEAGLSIAQELELQDEELMIRGHIDDLVLVKGTPALEQGQLVEVKDVENPVEILEAQRLILYDYKTAHSKWFEYVKGRPMSHYNKMQLGTYMYMLRKLSTWQKLGLEKHITANHMTEARILKISKDDLRLHEQQLMWSDEREMEVKAYWIALNVYWKSKKLPPCTCADHENGFMAKEKWNPYFYEGEPCSIKYYEKWKEEQKHDKVLEKIKKMDKELSLEEKAKFLGEAYSEGDKAYGESKDDAIKI